MFVNKDPGISSNQINQLFLQSIIVFAIVPFLSNVTVLVTVPSSLPYHKVCIY